MQSSIEWNTQIQQAAEAIRQADALLIGAGAGMGVDSGLPDFRGNAGFWSAYPALYGHSFAEMANPQWFHRDPEVAWGFYGHRLLLYRHTIPHAGFGILQRWIASRPAGHFLFTSNVDGHFQRSGFSEEQLYECHGSLQHLQCVKPCCDTIWPADSIHLTIDATLLRATSPLPVCPQCGGLARPNVLMFGDGSWISHRSDEQERRYLQWIKQVKQAKVVAIELGAGTAIPSVRWECQERAATLIRINPREADVPPGHISLPMGALEALTQIDQMLA